MATLKADVIAMAAEEDGSDWRWKAFVQEGALLIAVIQCPGWRKYSMKESALASARRTLKKLGIEWEER